MREDLETEVSAQNRLEESELIAYPATLEENELKKNFYQNGKLYYDKADLDKAEDYFLKFLNMSQRPREVFTSLKALSFLIRISSEKLDDDKAATYIALVEKSCNELTSLLGSLTAEYFYNLGVLKNYKGEFAEAKSNYLLAKKMAKEENDPELLSKCLLSLASDAFHHGQYQEAEEYLSQLSELLTIIDKSYIAGSMHLLSGRIALAKGEYDKSLADLYKANFSLQQKKCWNLYGYMLLWRGTIYKEMGKFEKAILFYQLALESMDQRTFKRLTKLLKEEISDVNDSNVDIYLDRTNRKVTERHLGTIDFKHRFVLLEILFLLAQNPGKFYDKDQLAKAIWKDEYNPSIHDKLIYTSVSRLRKLIEPESKDSNVKRKYIIRGKDGYTFNPLVRTRFHNISRAIGGSEAIANVELSSLI